MLLTYFNFAEASLGKDRLNKLSPSLPSLHLCVSSKNTDENPRKQEEIKGGLRMMRTEEYDIRKIFPNVI